MTAEPSKPLTDPDLADALADRALGRASSSLAIGAVALALMSLLFLQLAGGEPDARSLPQVVILGIGHLGGLLVAVACFVLLRRLRSAVDAGRSGTGPDAAAEGAAWLGRLVVGVPVTAVAAAVALLVTMRPLATAVLSVAVGLAVVSQLAVLAAVQRSGLRRAAVRR